MAKHKYKKYIVFQYEHFYPSGGLKDITGSFDDINQAKQFCENNHIEGGRPGFNDVVDRDTWDIVWNDETDIKKIIDN